MDAAVKALFTVETYEVYKHLETKTGPELGPFDSPYPNVNAFIVARDAAVKALYSEVI